MTTSRVPHPQVPCRSCGAGLLPGARFCTDCGTPVAAAAVPGLAQATGSAAGDRPHAQERERVPRLVECEVCGAGNAISRPLCARCGTPLRDEVPGGDALPETARQPVVPSAATGRRRESPPVLLSLVLLAGLLTAGVLLSLVMSRVDAPAAPAVAAGVELQAASATTALPAHPASLAIDGDATTAWVEGAEGDGDGEWLEVTMAGEVPVRRLVVWNGQQADEAAWGENGWASVVRIEVGDRQFRVRMQDVLGPQAIDLPESVPADRVRLVVEQAQPGSRYADLAISEVVVQVETRE